MENEEKKVKHKPVSIQERWDSDVNSLAYMFKHNPPEYKPITKEIREYYKKEYGITLLGDEEAK